MLNGDIYLLLSIISGLLTGIFWTLGDILIVGFSGDDQKSIAAFQNKGIKDPEMAAYMLPGSEKRLRWGALIPVYATPLMFFSLYSVYRLSASLSSSYQPLRIATLIIMTMGFSYSPLAHAGFYFIGTLAKNLRAEEESGQAITPARAELLNNYRESTTLAWLPAIGLTGLSWLLFLIPILLGQSILPRYFALLTPFTLSPLWIILVKKLKPFHPWLNGAAFNLGMLSYYLILLIWYLLSI